MSLLRYLSLVSIAVLTFSHPVLAEEIRPITFPVDGPNTFTDTWGAARSGGRVHLGTDIIAAKMTPLVSAVDGVVTTLTETEPSWGYAIYIKDSDGYSYRYLHINNDTPGTDDGAGGTQYAFAPGLQRGSRVTAGQLIGWAGDSGNAESVGSHLHFEIWNPEGVAINSYPSLIAAAYPQAPATTFQFTRDLDIGSRGQDVYELQKYLNRNTFTIATSGPGSPGNETDYFGAATQAALIKFQQAHGISPASGYFGPITRSVINQSGSTAAPPPASSVLQAGWLIKNTKYAEVFYVDQNFVLHWIINEQAAEKHFGRDWNQNIKEFDTLDNLGVTFGSNLE